MSSKTLYYCDICQKPIANKVYEAKLPMTIFENPNNIDMCEHCRGRLMKCLNAIIVSERALEEENSEVEE